MPSRPRLRLTLGLRNQVLGRHLVEIESTRREWLEPGTLCCLSVQSSRSEQSVARRPPHLAFQATFSPRGEGLDRASFGAMRFVPREPERHYGWFAPGMESRAGLAAPIDPSPLREKVAWKAG